MWFRLSVRWLGEGLIVEQSVAEYNSSASALIRFD